MFICKVNTTLTLQKKSLHKKVCLQSLLQPEANFKNKFPTSSCVCVAIELDNYLFEINAPVGNLMCVFINSVSFTPLTTKASSCIFTGFKNVKKFLESKNFYTFSVTKCDQIMRNFMQVKLLCYEVKMYKFLMFVLILYEWSLQSYSSLQCGTQASNSSEK